MSASKDFADIQRMLTECLPGHTIRMTDHFRRIKFGNTIYPSFPKSKTVEVGHIRKLVRFFKMEECAAKHGMP